MSQKKNGWFGLGFVFAGLIPAGILVNALWNWNSSRSWVETPARVMSAELRVESTGGRRPSHSKKLYVEYEYRWESSSIQNDSVSPFNSIEVFDSYKLKLKNRLHNAARLKEEVTCYVNPGNPSSAFLDRSFRWPSVVMMSGVSVLFVGCGMLLVRRANQR